MNGRISPPVIAALDTFEAKWPSGSYIYNESYASQGALLVADRLFFSPIWVPEARTTSEVKVDLTASGAGGTPTLRLGFYLPAIDGRPGALIVDAGTVDATVAAGLVTKALSQALPRGLVWGAVVAQGATVTQPSVRHTINAFSRWVNLTTIVATTAAGGYVQGSVSGALPATAAPSTVTHSNVPLLAIKAA